MVFGSDQLDLRGLNVFQRASAEPKPFYFHRYLFGIAVVACPTICFRCEGFSRDKRSIQLEKSRVEFAVVCCPVFPADHLFCIEHMARFLYCVLCVDNSCRHEKTTAGPGSSAPENGFGRSRRRNSVCPACGCAYVVRR